MVEIKTHIIPECTKLSVLFERVLLKKLPDILSDYKEVELTEKDDSIAFDFFQELLTEYSLNTIIFMDNKYFNEKHGDSTYLNHYYSLSSTENKSHEQMLAISHMKKALFVASYFQKCGENKRDYFKTISDEKKALIGYTDVESDQKNLIHLFWRLPFMIALTTHRLTTKVDEGEGSLH